MDRFMIKLSPGYLKRDEEVLVISEQLIGHPLDTTVGVTCEEDIFQVMDAVQSVRISEELLYYIIDIVRMTRNSERVAVGASVRASLALMKIAQALALFDGRGFVIPEDIREAAVAVIGHRLQIMPQAKFSGIAAQAVVQKVLSEIKSSIHRRRKGKRNEIYLIGRWVTTGGFGFCGWDTGLRVVTGSYRS